MASKAGAGTPADIAADTEDRSWFGHPRQLARLFSSEAMERFGYYGMRALLTLYLVQHFQFGDRQATGLYGAFTALVYLTPLIGGLIADRLIGSKRAVKLGAIVMAVGYAILCFNGPTAKPYAVINGDRLAVEEVKAGEERTQFVTRAGERLQIKGNDDKSVSLVRADGTEAERIAATGFRADADRDPFYVALMLLGLAAITVGNGFFKPNISTIVGSLYKAGDRRRDTGFTIFYMGINLGSLFSQFLCPILAVAFGWWAGFGVAALGMLIAWLLFQFDGGLLDGYGEAPSEEGARKYVQIALAAVVAVPLVWLLLNNAVSAAEGASILGTALTVTAVLFFVGVPVWSYLRGTAQEFQMMLAAMVLIFFNVFFWALFEQAGSSLTLFAERNTDREIAFLGWTMPAGSTQVFNPLFIVILAPIFSALWTRLGKRGMEPGIPVKFALALIGVGVGFLVLVAAPAGPDFKVALGWLALLYFIHSAAELMISPVGLSMITKLSIARIVGFMMGGWFLSISLAQYVAGFIAQLASVETVGGQVTNLEVSMRTYVEIFTLIGQVSIGAGVVLFLLSFPLKRLMHGVN